MKLHETGLGRVLDDELDSVQQFGFCGPRLFAGLSEIYAGGGLGVEAAESLAMNGVPAELVDYLRTGDGGLQVATAIITDLLQRYVSMGGASK